MYTYKPKLLFRAMGIINLTIKYQPSPNELTNISISEAKGEKR